MGTVAAVNDPGHDTLYVLKIGDNMTGSLNLTGSLTASSLRTASLIYGSYLDIWANGTLQTVTSRPALQAPNANSLYIDSTQNIYIATMGGTTGTVQFGPPGAGNTLIVNVSGNLLQQNIPVCLANGTNCLSGNNTGNITSINAGNGITVTNPNGPATTVAVNPGSGLAISSSQLVVDNATVCRSTGAGCPAGTSLTGSGAAGNITYWTNGTSLASTPIYLSSGNVGIGTTGANSKFDIQLASGKHFMVDDNNDGAIVTTSTVNLVNDTIGMVAGHNYVGTGVKFFGNSHATLPGETVFINNGSESMRIVTNGNVGIGTTTPGSVFEVTTNNENNGVIISDTGDSNRNTLRLMSPAGSKDYARIFAYKYGTGAGPKNLALNEFGGNVGIGTTTPATKLDVLNNFRVSGSSSDIWPSSGKGMEFVWNAVGSAGYGANGVGWIQAYNRDNSTFGDLSISANNTRFVSLGSESMRITGAGNVGIGTTAPNQKLDVNGSLNVSGSGILYAPQICLAGNCQTSWPAGGGAGGGWMNTSTVVSLANIANNISANTFFVDNTNGRVGIGTAAPNVPLHIYNSGVGELLRLQTAGANSYARIWYQTDAAYSWNVGFRNDTSPSRFAFENNYTGAWTQPFVITGTGNVGIGTTAPQAALHVAVTTGAVNEYITSGNASGVPALWLANNYSSTPNYGGMGLSTDNSLRFSTTGSFTNAGITLLPSGNVGIGTTAPTAKLQVVGVADGQIYLQPNPAANSQPIIAARVASGGYLGFAVRATVDPRALTDGAYADVRMVINSLGNVGIGTTGPGYKLDVAGLGPYSRVYNTNSGGYATGQIISGFNGGATERGFSTWFYDYASPYQNTLAYSANVVLGTAVNSIAFGQSSGANGASDTNYNPWMIIKSGNVGIGTTGPTNGKLVVSQGGGIPDLEISSSTVADTYGVGIRASGGSNANALRLMSAGGLVQLYDNSNTYTLNIYSGSTLGTSLTASGNSYFNGGNVGIGTTGPGAKLDVGTPPTSGSSVGSNTMARFSVPGDSLANVMIERGGVANPQGLYFGVNHASLYSEIQSSQSSVGVDALVLQRSGGNVGIGTTNPGGGVGASTGPYLHVSGGQAGSEPGLMLGNVLTNITGNRGRIDFAGTSNNGNPKAVASVIGKIESTGTNTVAGALTFETRNGDGTDAGERMRITSAGYVGIGTTNPGVTTGEKLTVVAGSGQTWATSFTTNDFNSGTNTGSAVLTGFGAASGSTYSRIQAANAGYSVNANLVLEPNGGNVGIGTTGPNAKLDVNGTVLIANGDYGSGGNLRFYNTTGSPDAGIYEPNSNILYFNSGVAGEMHFRNGSLADNMVIKNNNVGIGTTGPNAKLDVNGTVLIANGDYGSGGNLRFYNTTGSPDAGIYEPNSNILYFNSGVAGEMHFRNGSLADNMVIKNNNVGIGTTPGQTLEVNGVIRVDRLTAASATAVCRDANNDLSTCSSSRKFKTNITYLTAADYEKILNDITNTKVATFTYKTDHPNMTRYGIIAEEAPKPLQYIDENGNNNIDFYSVQTGYTWAGITAVHRENQALKTRVDTLETENHALKAAICRLSPSDPVCS